MKVQPIHSESGHDRWNGGSTLMPSEPGDQFRVTYFHHRTGEVVRARVATQIVAENVLWSVASQLPHQPDTTLLDRHLPPDPERTNARRNGGYCLTLYVEGERIASGGTCSFEEFTPEPLQPAVEVQRH